MGSFHHDQTAKARKQHKCAECHGNILAGENYVKHSGSDGGDFYSYKLCQVCDRIITEVSCATHYDDRDNLIIGQIYEQFEYHDAEHEWLEAYVSNMIARRGDAYPSLVERLEALNAASASNAEGGE